MSRMSSDKQISLISPFASCCERVHIIVSFNCFPSDLKKKGHAHRDQGFRNYVFKWIPRYSIALIALIALITLIALIAIGCE